MLNLSEAAKVSGQSKSAIWRAVNSRRLPATRTYTGDYQIDPAELHRVLSSETVDERAATASVKRGENWNGLKRPRCRSKSKGCSGLAS